MGEGSGRGSGQPFCRQSRVGSGQRFAGSGPRKVTRGQLCYTYILLSDSYACCIIISVVYTGRIVYTHERKLNLLSVFETR